jgi:hypothetical protein
MEDHMNDLTQTAIDLTPRRGFLGRVASAMGIGLAGIAWLAPTSLHAQAGRAQSDGPNWPGTLKGRHRQIVDAYEVNSGFPLAFAYTFLAPNESATAVIILRHGAFPIALGDAMWAKYKIGETFKIIDPETKAPAMKNPFFHPKPGVLIVDDMALDRLLAKGAVVGGCNVALQVQSKMLAGNAGMSAEDAAKEWAANVIPGVTIIPSGTWGVNRAQEGGCTYCAGG